MKVAGAGGVRSGSGGSARRVVRQGPGAVAWWGPASGPGACSPRFHRADTEHAPHCPLPAVFGRPFMPVGVKEASDAACAVGGFA